MKMNCIRKSGFLTMPPAGVLSVDAAFDSYLESVETGLPWRTLALVAMPRVRWNIYNYSRYKEWRQRLRPMRGATPMGTPAPDSSRMRIPQKESPAIRCRICDKPVAIETAKSDCDGNAFHGECYALKIKLEQASQGSHAPATRPWKVVAAEVSREQDPNKMTELVAELNQALEEQDLDGTPKPKSEFKAKPDSKNS